MKTQRIKTLLLFLSMIPFIGIYAQSIYYVSPHASSGGDGSQSAPFHSIPEAVEKARKDQNSTTIYLREGKYVLDKPLMLTSDDGNDSKELIIKNYPGEKTVLSSGIVLDLKWEKYKNGIMRAVVKGSPVMDMLFVNGELKSMARYPNYDEKAVRFNGTSALATAPERVKKWKCPEGGYLHAMHKHDWGDFHYRITGKNEKGELQLEGGWQNNRPMGIHNENRMVENIFEELDAPGEWYYDKKEGWLYYYPLPDEKINELTFETPQLKNLIEFAGTSSEPVKNITIQGIELTQTIRTFMEQYEPLLRSDWTIYRGGTVVFRGTEKCALRDCYIHNVGGNGVFFDKYNRYSAVTGSYLTSIGASAICFVGDVAGVRSPSFRYGKFVPLDKMDYTKGPQNDNHPAYCKVSDNLICTIGLFEKQITGVELSMCRNITVSHNSIYNTPRAGINISEGTWGGHIIEYNDIFNTVKETGDHGTINSWGRDRFWHPNYNIMTQITNEKPALILADVVEPIIIRHNRLRCDRGWDIDLDDGSSNYQIYNNLCLNGGIKLREGFYRTVENNIIVNNTLHPHLWFKNSGDVFSRNIVMTKYKPISVRGWGREVDYNIFADSLAYLAARQLGGDAHSIVTTVKFMDAAKGNFNVADDSEVVTKGGFRNFPMNNFGVLSSRLKRLAASPVMPVPLVAGHATDTKTMFWKGVTFKNLDTLEERSATGMDTERGVYVVSVDVLGSNQVRDFIASNDVILSVNGKPVNNLDDMEEALKHVDTSKKAELVIFRNQKEHKVVIPL